MHRAERRLGIAKTRPTLQSTRACKPINNSLCEAMKQCGFDYARAIYHNNPDGNGPRALAVHNLDWITPAGLRFIDQYKDQPFFLYFAVTVPHGPGDAKRSWNADPPRHGCGFS